MRRATIWVMFIALGIILIITGIEGRVGSMLGAFITPSQMVNKS